MVRNSVKLSPRPTIRNGKPHVFIGQTGIFMITIDKSVALMYNSVINSFGFPTFSSD